MILRLLLLLFCGLFSVSLSAKSFQAGQFDYYVLALSWQPTFCEFKPRAKGCDLSQQSTFATKNFVLHGLWPNLNNDRAHRYGYCDVSDTTIQKDKKGRWCQSPQLTLSQATRDKLEQIMPGSQSCLQRHEWYKHGSCSGLSADQYYQLSQQLVESFATTKLSQYISQNIGKFVKRKTLLNYFDQDFGPKSRKYLALRCRKTRKISLLSELQIQMKKGLDKEASFKENLDSGRSKVKGNCPRMFKIDIMD